MTSMERACSVSALLILINRSWNKDKTIPWFCFITPLIATESWISFLQPSTACPVVHLTRFIRVWIFFHFIMINHGFHQNNYSLSERDTAKENEKIRICIEIVGYRERVYRRKDLGHRVRSTFYPVPSGRFTWLDKYLFREVHGSHTSVIAN